MMLSGSNPAQAFTALFQGSLGSLAACGRTLEKSTPLIFSGLAVAFAFKAGLFNIGVQGQLLFGSLTAAAIGFGIQGLPAVIHVPLALLAGALAGGVYGAIPGLLKAFTGAHEVITCIMFNYVAINITDFLTNGPLKDTSSGNIIARTPLISETCRIPGVGGVPMGFVIALLAAVLIWWLLGRTTAGFDIRTVGLNPHGARYAGINVRRTLILSMIMSGVLAGLGGAVETQGIVYRYQPGFNVGLGFEGITVALLGRTHPLGVIPAALLFGAMKAGAGHMQFNAGVSKEIVDVIQAMILFFVAADIFLRRIVRSRATDGETLSLSTGWGMHP
jgi:simple sugar transport system permease protein